jgi:hypothetical protein
MGRSRRDAVPYGGGGEGHRSRADPLIDPRPQRRDQDLKEVRPAQLASQIRRAPDVPERPLADLHPRRGPS